MIGFLLQGILIGLLFGIPAGAVGAMTAQRTFNYGGRAGLMTGLGSSVADCFYASVGAFGLTLVSDFLLRWQNIIHLIGGGFIFFMGVCLLRKKKETLSKEEKRAGDIGLFFSSFAVGITNPAAILTFLFAFSWFGIMERLQLWEGIALVCGVFLGTYLWWGTLTGAIVLLKKRAKSLRLELLNQIFGSVLILFGFIVLVQFVREIGG